MNKWINFSVVIAVQPTMPESRLFTVSFFFLGGGGEGRYFKTGRESKSDEQTESLYFFFFQNYKEISKQFQVSKERLKWIRENVSYSHPSRVKESLYHSAHHLRVSLDAEALMSKLYPTKQNTTNFKDFCLHDWSLFIVLHLSLRKVKTSHMRSPIFQGQISGTPVDHKRALYIVVGLRWWGVGRPWFNTF